ncbi:MAG: Ig-like domain-containing protein [Acidimicrobiales bacterium]
METLNPSNDDNIFFGAFTLNSTTAVVGEGITLSPATATNPVGQNHTLTATVQDDNGDPIANRAVTFKVLSGPRAGLTGSANTNVSGKATFSYTSNVVGTDTIRASFQNGQNVTVNSNTVTKTWVASGNSPTTCVVTAVRAGPPKQQDVTVRDLDGIASITNVNVINGTVAVPSFAPGIKTPIVLTATKTNQTQRTFWEFDVTDSKGVKKHCV